MSLMMDWIIMGSGCKYNKKNLSWREKYMSYSILHTLSHFYYRAMNTCCFCTSSQNCQFQRHERERFQLTPDEARGYVVLFRRKTLAPCHSWATDTCTPLWTSSGRERALCGWSRRDLRSEEKTTKALLGYFWLFGSVLVSLVHLHVQAFVGTAVHLGDRWRGRWAHIAVVPAPVAAAAAVRELAASTLHVGWRGGTSWGEQGDSSFDAGYQSVYFLKLTFVFWERTARNLYPLMPGWVYFLGSFYSAFNC